MLLDPELAGLVGKQHNGSDGREQRGAKAVDISGTGSPAALCT
jgi:hypothetical protein